jgi:rhodanese-related sulfurtransferase
MRQRAWLLLVLLLLAFASLSESFLSSTTSIYTTRRCTTSLIRRRLDSTPVNKPNEDDKNKKNDEVPSVTPPQPKCLPSNVKIVSTKTKFSNITPKEFGKILQSDELRKTYQIIDLREAPELRIAKLPYDDVISLPLTLAKKWFPLIEANKFPIKFDRKKPTILFCHTECRSYMLAHEFGKFLLNFFLTQ